VYPQSGPIRVPIRTGGEPIVLDPTTSEPQQIDPAGFAGDLEVDVDRRGPGLAVLSVRGEIDSLTTPGLEAELAGLLADPPDQLVLDLVGVTFLASSGLAVLIRAAQVLGERSRRLRLVVSTRAVRRPLQITGSDQLFDLFDDLDSAVGGPV
jgi:anti-sigma B factor antagonist